MQYARRRMRRKASQFTITQVLHPVNATMVDLGLYAEDDWKARPNLSISYGIRYETQNHLATITTLRRVSRYAMEWARPAAIRRLS